MTLSKNRSTLILFLARIPWFRNFSVLSVIVAPQNSRRRGHMGLRLIHNVNYTSLLAAPVLEDYILLDSFPPAYATGRI